MTEFKWAHDKEANVKEPLEAIKKNGWQYGDIPTASNFNWLFKEISQELANAKQALEKFKIESEKELKKLRESNANTHKYVEEVGRVTEQNSQKLSQSKTEIIDNYGRMRQICHYLYKLEDTLRRQTPVGQLPMLPFSPEGQPLSVIKLGDFKVIEGVDET